MSPLTVRTPGFAYPADFDPRWHPTLPEFACAANALSLLMPYIEPYFAKTTRSALDRLEPELRARADAYLRQELAHHVEHRRLNDLLTARYRGLKTIENVMRRSYRRLERKRSLAFNLAFAAGTESLAFGAARWIERHRRELFDRADPQARALFLWHLAEEIEHKSVGFDVFEAVDGKRLRYAIATSISLAMFAAFVLCGTLVMLVHERRIWSPLAWIRLIKWALTFVFEVLPVMFVAALPGHHPNAFESPLWLENYLKEYDAGLLDGAAATTPSASRESRTPLPAR